MSAASEPMGVSVKWYVRDKKLLAGHPRDLFVKREFEGTAFYLAGCKSSWSAKSEPLRNQAIRDFFSNYLDLDSLKIDGDAAFDPTSDVYIVNEHSGDVFIPDRVKYVVKVLPKSKSGKEECVLNMLISRAESASLGRLSFILEFPSKFALAWPYSGTSIPTFTATDSSSRTLWIQKADIGALFLEHMLLAIKDLFKLKLVHGDLVLRNVVWNPKARHFGLIDYGSMTRLTDGMKAIVTKNVLESAASGKRQNLILDEKSPLLAVQFLGLWSLYKSFASETSAPQSLRSWLSEKQVEVAALVQ